MSNLVNYDKNISIELAPFQILSNDDIEKNKQGKNNHGYTAS